MSIPKTYDASKHENDIYQMWEESGEFQPSEKAEETFTIMMPPPNATGQLHLGHATMLALQDIIIRHKRMQGYAALWLPGTDHASIATQNKVEQIIATKDLTRHDLGRKKFLKEVEDYVANSKKTIRKQIRKMGSSCDWSRERYTMDEGLSKAVNEVFVRMYNDGLIYRGNRIVNWCPRCSSTLADDEVEYKEKQTNFYYLNYGPFTIGTARPETKFSDKVVIVHPDDERYQEYHDREFEIDWINGKIKAKVIADEVMDQEMGTGAMTITPAHSFTDFELAQKYDLSVEQIINEEGKMTKAAGKYEGMDVQECREKLVKEMKEKGLVKEIDENYTHNLSVCYRCDTPIEPLVSKQWFIDVRKPVVNWKREKKSIQDITISVVKEDEIEILPKRFDKQYFNWVENLRDWCISRQIWFGHRIPVWYKEDDIKVQAEKPGEGWKQDPDTLDTWFSSGLWTFSTLGWPEYTHDLKRFHPTDVLETGYDILTFWIIRMIIMTTYALEEIPYKKVYLHGLVRDKQGQKMSKSKGNGIDPLDMIAKYGTDAVRLSLVVGTSPGNDIKLYEEKIASYRNFVNKVWNIARFTLLNIDEKHLPLDDLKEDDIKTLADAWIITRTQELIKDVTTSLKKYRFSEAGLEIYNFLWSEFADWYVEISKAEKNEKVLYYVLKQTLKMLHPFTPFVTETLWEKLGEKTELIAEDWPKHKNDFIHPKLKKEMERVIDIVTQIRVMKADFNLSAVTDLTVTLVDKANTHYIKENLDVIKQLTKLKEIDLRDEDTKLRNTTFKVVDSKTKVYLHIEGKIDIKEEITKAEKEMKETLNYVKSQEQKLKNKKFLENAPKQAIDNAKEALENAQAKIKELKSRVTSLS